MIYFDNAATARFTPREVLAAFVKEQNAKSNPGRGGHSDSIQSALSVYRAREKISKLFGNQGGETVFTKNCTEALNLAILGSAKKGHVITTVSEHNSVLRPLSFLMQEKLINVSYATPDKSGRITAERILPLLRPDTYLIIINACSNVNGSVNDTEEICALATRSGLRCLVDAAQSSGHYHFDMKACGCDMLASAGHKGLHGVQGTGFLLVNPRIRLKPIMYGGTGTESISIVQPKEYPEALEAGTLNCAGICALDAGVSWTDAHFDRIRRKNKGLSEYIVNGLGELPFIRLFSKPNFSGIVAFDVKGVGSEKVSDYLNENGIAVRGGLHCAPLMHRQLGTLSGGLVRVSVGYCNTHYDASELLYAMRDFVRKL